VAFCTQNVALETSSLGLLQRLFLVCDGTLTDILEAAVDEPIALRKLLVGTALTPFPVDELDLPPGSALMTRRILLYGEKSRRNYIYAESLIATERLPARFRDELVHHNTPLGRLWLDFAIESRKQLVESSRCFACGIAAHLCPDNSHEELLRRSYKVISGGIPLMLITEYVLSH
jgi:chorismate-pyruvate lyase